MRAKEIRITLLAARPRLAPLEEPQGRTTGPALPTTFPTRAFRSKAKLAIVNPQRRMGCAALMPEYSLTPECLFTLHHCLS